MTGILADVARENDAPGWLLLVAVAVALAALIAAVLFLIRNRHR
ncbi:hypothetical protein [Spirillospora sp. NPDC029432]